MAEGVSMLMLIEEPLEIKREGGLYIGPPLFGLYPNGLFTIGLFMIGLSPFGLPMMFGLSPFGLF